MTTSLRAEAAEFVSGAAMWPAPEMCSTAPQSQMRAQALEFVPGAEKLPDDGMSQHQATQNVQQANEAAQHVAVRIAQRLRSAFGLGDPRSDSIVRALPTQVRETLAWTEWLPSTEVVTAIELYTDGLSTLS